MSWDMVTDTAFEIQFPGDACPVAFVPGADRVGAITGGAPWGTGEWRTQADHDLFEDMYPRMRPGLVLVQVNGEDVIYLDFDSIMTMIDEAKQPRVFLFTERASKWAIVRARLRDGTLRKLRRQHGGVNPAERAWRRRVAQNMRRGAQKGDMQEFNRWVLKTNDIDAQDRERGATTLHIACESGATKIVKALVRRNADVYVRDKEGRTCLHGAVKRRQHGAVKALLKSSAAASGDLVNVEDYQGRTPMHLAAEGGDMKMLFRLLRAGARTDVRERAWAFLPIHFAACNGHTDVVRWLIDHAGQNVHAESHAGRQPLELSDGFGWDAVSEMLRRQIVGEPLHLVIASARHPWLCQADAALSPKAKRGRMRLKRAREGKRTVAGEGGRGGSDSDGRSEAGKQTPFRCERLYLGTWQSINEWWLRSRGITAVVTLFDPDRFSARAVQRRLRRARQQKLMRSRQRGGKYGAGSGGGGGGGGSGSDDDDDEDDEDVAHSTARAVRFAFQSLQKWEEASDDSAEEDDDERPGVGSDSSESEFNDDDGQSSVFSSSTAGSSFSHRSRLHHHIKIPNFDSGRDGGAEEDWSELLRNFPRFGKIFDPIVSGGKHRRVLVASYGWSAGAAAIVSWMMTRRGLEREDKGLPFFRFDEALDVVRYNLPEGTLPIGVIEPVLERLQVGLDKRRQAKLNARVADLFKAI